MKQIHYETLTLEKIVGGGQALGTLDDGRKAFVWGGLPGETVTIRLTKKKSHFVEGIVTHVETPSLERVTPLDPDSYLSTSPWQIMTFDAEQHYKAALIEEAFELHDIVLPDPIDVYTDGREYHYRNKVEFSWFGSYEPSNSDLIPTKSDETSTARASADAYSTEARSEAVSEDFGGEQGSGEDGVSGSDASSAREGSALAEAHQDKRQLVVGRPERADEADEMECETKDNRLDLAFFQRGGKGKIIVTQSSLLPGPIMTLALTIRDLLQSKHVSARDLKTLLIRSDQRGNCVWQLYIKSKLTSVISPDEAKHLPAQGGEIIYSDPRSPASRITERLASFGDIVLTDTVLGVPFRYATEGFFQVNIPVYEQALRDMKSWVDNAPSLPSGSPNVPAISSAREGRLSPLPSSQPQEVARRSLDTGPASESARSEAVTSGVMGGEEYAQPVLDLYSGVGSIGLTIGGDNVTLVEINEDAVREMRRNITALGREGSARAVLAPSEKALDYITSDSLVIVDPPRAGLHADVIAKLLEAAPARIIYLSCNPVTQARDVALLAAAYGIRAHRGYNFFPHTPHIEHLVILDKK